MQNMKNSSYQFTQKFSQTPMKNYFLTISIFLTYTCFSQNDYKVAHNAIISIDSVNNEISYLHFRINTFPEYAYDMLTDIHYSVKYREFGTPEEVTWVKLFDGHLVNDINHEYSFQWKGPFPGNRDISYKFFFELINDSIENTNKLKTIVFSTNPTLDYAYCNLDYNAPFEVTAYYYNIDNIKKIINIYSSCSAVYTIYSLAKGANPGVAVAWTIGETIVIYAVNAYLENLPIYLTVKCNVCGHTESIKIENLNYRKIYKCSSYGCQNMAEIRLIK
jgi:hypothetical protein